MTTTTKKPAESGSAFTADTQVVCQILSEQVPVPEPKQVSQPTRTYTHMSCMSACGHWSLHSLLSCESYWFKALKAKDGTCRAIERER